MAQLRPPSGALDLGLNEPVVSTNRKCGANHARTHRDQELLVQPTPVVNSLSGICSDLSAQKTESLNMWTVIKQVLFMNIYV